MKRGTDVSIVICTRNRSQSLQRTLESIDRVEVPDDLRAELIVADSGSMDGTSQVLQQFRPRHLEFVTIRCQRSGKSHALNHCIRAASGEIILTTDDDVLVPDHWIAGMLAPFRQGADAASGGVSLPVHLRRPWFEAEHMGWLSSSELSDPSAQPFLVGANMGFHRRVLNRVPGFDEEVGPGAIGHAEDTLFTLQLREAGFAVVSNIGTIVEHHVGLDRLTRCSFEAQAQRRGEMRAYLNHHWFHYRVKLPHLRRALAQLAVHRYQMASNIRTRAKQIIDRNELLLLETLHGLRHYCVERQRPRHYSKRGLVKRTL